MRNIRRDDTNPRGARKLSRRGEIYFNLFARRKNIFFQFQRSFQLHSLYLESHRSQLRPASIGIVQSKIPASGFFRSAKLQGAGLLFSNVLIIDIVLIVHIFIAMRNTGWNHSDPCGFWERNSNGEIQSNIVTRTNIVLLQL